MSKYHFHREKLLPVASKAGQPVEVIHPSNVHLFRGRPCWETAPRSLNVDQEA